MAKSKKLCKKPLLLISLCVALVFAVTLVVLAMVPYAATPYKNVSESGNTQIEYVFKKGVYEKTTTNTNSITGTTTNTVEVEYTIEDRVVKEGNLGVAVGEINAYTFTVGDTVYTNTFTKVLKIVSIVGVALGGVGVVLYFVLSNKNNKSSSKKK